MKTIFLTSALLLLCSGVAFAEGKAQAEFEELGTASETAVESNDGLDIALGAKISTLGVGPELTVGFNKYLAGRISGGWGEFGVDAETDDIDWDGDMKLANGLGTVEWYCFGGGFHIDAGVLVHDNHVEASAQGAPGATVEYNGTIYTSEQAGKVSGDVEFGDSVAPYLGIGWGNPVSDDDTWSMFFNLGVVFQGSPSVSLTATGTLAGDPGFQSDLALEQKELEDELEKFEYYPVITLGLAYKF